MQKLMRKLLIDFDGVLNTYSGWQGNKELFEPKEGVTEFLEELSSSYQIYIFIARPPKLIKKWLIEYSLEHYISGITKIKEPAYAYIDDRGIKFEGNYESTIKELVEFSAWWEN